MKTTKGKTKRNDLTLEIKERIKEYPSRVKSRTNSSLLKNDHVCPQSLFINIFGKIKEKGNLYLSLRTTGERYEKEEVKTPEVS
jgi:predicted component of type VI protein secretion system